MTHGRHGNKEVLKGCVGGRVEREGRGERRGAYSEKAVER